MLSLDLVNLFPVKLDLKPFVDAWGRGVTFILWSPVSGSLRFCGLDAQPDSAWAYQTNDVYTTTGDPVYAADLIPVVGEGEEIDPDDYLGSGNAPGVLAFEAANEVSRSDALMLFVMDGDDVLFAYSLPLALRSVHDMYSWIGARHLSGEEDYRNTVVNRMWEGEAVKSLMFLHGANVSGAAAQEWGDAVFKRLWLSGAKIEFYNVDWRSDIGSSANYHENASNAFVVASQLAPILSNIPGDKVIMAHSLGNMVVSSMIQDYGLVPFCYLMCNSAVPAEAYDDDLSLRVPQLVHPEWEAYPTNSWTSSWHWLFRNELNDDRRLLGWPRRFSNVARYAVNFYSTGDEILELAAVNNLWPTTGIWGDNTFGHLSWHKQELFKGRGIGVGMGATDWSGWNIEENWLGVNKISVAEAQTMTEADFRTNTVFYCYPSSMNQPTISLLVRGAHLALGIPTLTPAAGRIKFGDVRLRSQSFDCNVVLQIARPNNWPSRSEYQGQWCHSDLKDVAYFYNFKFYEKAIEKGNLK